MDEVTHQLPATTAPEAKPGLIRRIVAFPLSLLLIEFVVIAVVAVGYTQLAHRLIAKGDGAAYAAGGVVLAVLLVIGRALAPRATARQTPDHCPPMLPHWPRRIKRGRQ